jgi:hypothetical protein
MSIIAKCECGNRMALSDNLAGRTVRCSKCGGDVLVPAQSTGVSAASRQNMANLATPSVQINPALLMGGTVGTIALVIFLALYFGPWQVGRQWTAMSSSANDQVTDVVQFAISAYESQRGLYDVALAHNAPQTEGPANFVPPMMAFTMPRRIIFSGKTNRGNYIGTYDTQTGDIIADIQTGGYSVGGLVDVKQATGNFHITGREKNGVPAAEINGISLKIASQKPQGRDE